jgi:hypothetical protein
MAGREREELVGLGALAVEDDELPRRMPMFQARCQVADAITIAISAVMMRTMTYSNRP